jgi:N-acyl amino acid synthase of PEP-CTERM/exosortase system
MGLTHLARENRFETILADTDQSRDVHFRFRYKIFCQETGFEQASAFPDKKERDQYDEASVHFIVWDHLHQNVAGAMRLVDASETGLPIEDITSGCVLAPWRARSRSIEFSRLCIDRRYIRIQRNDLFGVRKSAHGKDRDEISILFHQEDNEILLRLVHAIIAWSKTHDKVFCFFLTTKALARVLQRQKVLMEAVGPSVSHRGERVPYLANIPATHEEMKAGNAAYGWLVGGTCKPFVKASTLPPLARDVPVVDQPAGAPSFADDARPYRDLRRSPLPSKMVSPRQARG